jgi:hypothetical protein
VSWTSDNLDTSHFTDAGNVPATDRCRHNMLTVYCRKCSDTYPIPDQAEMACTAGEDRRESRRRSGLLAAALILALAVGVALGWIAGGVR